MREAREAYSSNYLNIITKPARKRAKNSFDILNSLSIQINKCERQSKNILEDLRIYSNIVISINLSVFFIDEI